jgi:hypothetical protein
MSSTRADARDGKGVERHEVLHHCRPAGAPGRACDLGARDRHRRAPIRGEFTVGVVGVEQRCGAGALTIGFAGSGLASHLGRITGTGSNCTAFDLAVSAVPIYDGVASFVAADGSTLVFAYEGEQQAPVDLRAITITTNTVIGGTGRFVDASGSWTTVGTIDLAAGVFSGSFSGWVSN